MYRIDAPNNVFFNDDLTLDKKPVHRGRKLHRQQDGYESEGGREKNLVPIVKRNLTPDDHTNKQDVDSYLLVDNNGQPKKVYIKRNVPIKVINQKDAKSKTLDYSDDRLEEGSVNNF